MNIAICACSALSPNIILASSLFRSEGGRCASAFPFSFSCSSMLLTPFYLLPNLS
jgi:hypothetical protein